MPRFLLFKLKIDTCENPPFICLNREQMSRGAAQRVINSVVVEAEFGIGRRFSFSLADFLTG